MNHAPLNPAAPARSLVTLLRNPYTLHRALGVVLWLALAVVLAWRGGA